jgi:ferredoxin
VPRQPVPVLEEGRCTGCGLCVSACPSNAVILLRENAERTASEVVFPWRGSRPWVVGEFATLLNRRGESLGSGRVLEVPSAQRVRVEVPPHLLWEARALRPPKASAAVDEAFVQAFSHPEDQEKKVEITFNGEKRLVQPGIPLSLALFETGHNRASELLSCPDGSCSLCSVMVDGSKRLACRTEVRKGMNVRLDPAKAAAGGESPARDAFCICLGVTREQVLERVRQGKLCSAEAVLSSLHLGEGKCHGQLCMDVFRRILEEEGVDAAQWIDWGFPWSEWTLG